MDRSTNTAISIWLTGMVLLIALALIIVFRGGN